MKRVIFLRTEYRKDVFPQCLQAFKTEMDELLSIKAFKIVKEYPPHSILIEYADIMHDKMYEALRKAPIVELIDSIIPEKDA